MNVGSTTGGSSAFQGFGVNNDRQNDRPSTMVARQEEAEPFRRDDEKSRPAAVEAQSSKRSGGKNRGGQVDFSV